MRAASQPAAPAQETATAPVAETAAPQPDSALEANASPPAHKQQA
jgi:hypothetical protein